MIKSRMSSQFIGYTYAHLVGALGVVGVSAENNFIKDLGWVGYLGALILDIILFFLLLTMNPGPMKYFIFFLYLAILGQFIAFFIDRMEEKGTLRKVLASVAGLFITMTVAGFLDNQNFLGFGGLLFVGLIGVLLGRIGLLIYEGTGGEALISDNIRNIISWISTVLFTVYVAYDTQVLKLEAKHGLKKGVKADYINSSFALFLDIINLFFNIGEIMD